MNYFNYFTEIEDAFIRRRGKHLWLSPMDWALMTTWRERGVPLHIALRGVEKSFDSYEAKPRRRTVKSLLYCQEEVEAQFDEWRERQTGAHDEAAANGDRAHGADAEAKTNGAGELPFPREAIAAHLASSRAETERAREARCAAHGEDELCEALARASARLAELEADFAAAARPDAEQLEGALSDVEALLDRAVRVSVAPERIATLQREADEQLKPYRARMERAVYEQTRDNLIAKTLRDEYQIPRLSLFYL